MQASENKIILNQKGFTLIEIIAVLVILGILAAVAVPKFLSIADAGRQQMAKLCIAEMKSRLSQAQYKYILVNGSAPNAADLYTYASSQFEGNLTDVGPDFNVKVSKTAPMMIVVTKVQGEDIISVVDFFQAAGD